MARRKPLATAIKMNSLIFIAALRAKEIGGWSRDRTYDPLPDFLELQDVAARRLRSSAAADCVIADYHAVLADCISLFEGVSVVQRMGNA